MAAFSANAFGLFFTFDLIPKMKYCFELPLWGNILYFYDTLFYILEHCQRPHINLKFDKYFFFIINVENIECIRIIMDMLEKFPKKNHQENISNSNLCNLPSGLFGALRAESSLIDFVKTNFGKWFRKGQNSLCGQGTLRLIFFLVA